VVGRALERRPGQRFDEVLEKCGGLVNHKPKVELSISDIAGMRYNKSTYLIFQFLGHPADGGSRCVPLFGRRAQKNRKP